MLSVDRLGSEEMSAANKAEDQAGPTSQTHDAREVTKSAATVEVELQHRNQENEGSACVVDVSHAESMKKLESMQDGKSFSSKVSNVSTGRARPTLMAQCSNRGCRFEALDELDGMTPELKREFTQNNNDSEPQSNCCAACCRWFGSFSGSHKPSLFLFVLGLVLIATGEVLWFVNHGLVVDFRYTFSLLIIGGILTAPLLGVLVFMATLGLLEVVLPACVPGNSPNAVGYRYKLTVAQHYVNGVNQYLPTVYAFAMAIIVWFASIPRTLRVDTFKTAFDAMISVDGFLCLFVIAFMMARITRMYFVQDFGTRNYTSRMLATIRYQKIILNLLEKQDLGSFGTLFARVMDAEQIDPSLWNTLKTYIHTHQVDGYLLAEGAIHRSGSCESMYPECTTVASFITQRVMSVVPPTYEEEVNEDGNVGYHMKKEDFIQHLSAQYPELKPHLETWWTEFVDRDDLGYVRESGFKKSITELYRDRQTLSLTIQDASEVLKSMDTAFLTGYLFIWFILSLSIFNLTLGTSLAGIFSAILAWSFVFGNTIRDSFEGLVFLFSSHIYDTGDKVEFDDMLGEVDRIRTLTTDFVLDSGKFLRVENSKLRSSKIVNLSTSRSYSQAIVFYLPAADFTMELVDELRIKLAEFIKKHPKDFVSSTLTARELTHPGLTGSSPESGLLVKFTAFTGFTRNCYQTGANHIARTVLLAFLCSEFRRLGVVQPLISQNLVSQTDHYKAKIKAA